MSWALQWARPVVLASWLRGRVWEAATGLQKKLRTVRVLFASIAAGNTGLFSVTPADYDISE